VQTDARKKQYVEHPPRDANGHFGRPKCVAPLEMALAMERYESGGSLRVRHQIGITTFSGGGGCSCLEPWSAPVMGRSNFGVVRGKDSLDFYFLVTFKEF
jgi:hypothetical protein